jgi:selenocysteine lyase/cysteine desulfurase
VAACDAIDFLMFSPYKLMAPHLGVLFARAERLRELTPLLPTLCFYDKASALSWELGTPPYESLAGWCAALEYVAVELGGAPEGAPLTRAALERGFALVEQLEAPVKAQLVRGLAGIEGVSVFGSTELADRVGTVAFRVRGVAPADVALQLGEASVCVGNGHFYALLPIGALGLLEDGGIVRASIAHYTSPDDVRRLLEGVERIAKAAAAAAAT